MSLFKKIFSISHFFFPIRTVMEEKVIQFHTWHIQYTVFTWCQCLPRSDHQENREGSSTASARTCGRAGIKTRVSFSAVCLQKERTSIRVSFSTRWDCIWKELHLESRFLHWMTFLPGCLLASYGLLSIVDGGASRRNTQHIRYCGSTERKKNRQISRVFWVHMLYKPFCV